MKEGIKNVGQQERPHRFYCGPREHPGEFGGCKSETAAARVTPDRVGFGPLLCILSTLMGVQRAPHPPSSQHQPLPPTRTTLRDDPEPQAQTQNRTNEWRQEQSSESQEFWRAGSGNDWATRPPVATGQSARAARSVPTPQPMS